VTDMNQLFSVVGKVAVVTGGSRGIGAMIAKGFVDNGVKTYITSRKMSELNATAKLLSEFGECIPIPSDLSSAEGIAEFANIIKEKEPALHILVNNAGAAWGESIDTFPESGWDKVMDLNVKSPFFLTQQLLPSLRHASNTEDPARVINITSINGITNPKMTNYSYSASKAALIHLTRHLAADLVKDNINVNSIAPGFFPSKMTAFLVNHHAQEVAASIPRGRIGIPEDIAGTAIYLSSRASSWMTGQTLVLDGGQVACSG
jgi:NAD(P)-dependent dehydrogenase (short-subunit alcohol dehydrogenase family)